MGSNFKEKLQTCILYFLELSCPVPGKPSVLDDPKAAQHLIEILIAIHSKRRLILITLVGTTVSLGIMKYKSYRKNKKKLK